MQSYKKKLILKYQNKLNNQVELLKKPSMDTGQGHARGIDIELFLLQ